MSRLDDLHEKDEAPHVEQVELPLGECERCYAEVPADSLTTKLAWCPTGFFEIELCSTCFDDNGGPFR